VRKGTTLSYLYGKPKSKGMHAIKGANYIERVQVKSAAYSISPVYGAIINKEINLLSVSTRKFVIKCTRHALRDLGKCFPRK